MAGTCVYLRTVYCLCAAFLVLAAPGAQSDAKNPEEPAPIPGGLSHADVNDEHVKNAAAFALKAIDNRQNSAYKQVLVQLVSAKTQVVEGVMYHLQLEVGTSNCRKGIDDANTECSVKEDSNNQLCDVKVWERSWLNQTKVTEVSCSPKSRQIRAATLTGGLSDADVNDPSIKDIVKYAFQEVDKSSNSAYRQKLIRTVSVKTQVVAGALYHITLEVGESNCEKGSNKADSECALKEGSSIQTCTVKVWDRPWLPKREITKLQCTS